MSSNAVHEKSCMRAQATIEAMLSFLFLLIAILLILPSVSSMHSSIALGIQSSSGSQSLAYDALLIGTLSSLSYGQITSLPSSLYAHGASFSPAGRLVHGKSLPGNSGFAYIISNHSISGSTFGVYDEIPQ